MVDEVALYDDDPHKVVKVDLTEVPQRREEIIKLLRKYRDVFAWSPLDMTGVSPTIITHRLNIDPAVKPVRQKKRTFAADRNQGIHKEVDQLLKADTLFDVKYPTWLANPVMVRKEGGE